MKETKLRLLESLLEEAGGAFLGEWARERIDRAIIKFKHDQKMCDTT